MGGLASHPVDPAVDRAADLFHELAGHKTDEAQFAAPMERVMARLIELAAWLFIGFFWSVMVYYVDRWFFTDPLVASPETGQLYRPEHTEPVVGWMGAFALLLTIFAVEVFPTAVSGRSFGKKLMKLQVVRPDRSAPGVLRASTRFVAWWLPLAVAGALWSATFPNPLSLLFMLLGIAVLVIPGTLFREDHHRGLHDRLAGTVVVSER
ncbi:MAG: RDD family protein [Dehalococcoidia bacterium]